MGHSSKFVFPLPGRKSKAAAPQGPLPPVPVHLTTKAQRILGTAELSVDQLGIPGLETQSNSGISIAVTETTNGEHGHGTAHDGWAAGGQRDRRWEQESEIIPTALSRQPDMSVGPDGTTDASSLRRRQSSSTITSYYDKSKLPLSISQQTSNSAMAKGLPPKAQALLDIDGELTESAHARKTKKKPSRLDLSALLQKHRSPKHLHPESRGNLLGHDMLTKSPSLMSVSPAPTPPPVSQRTDRGIRKKLTRESLKEYPAQQPPYPSADHRDGGKEGRTKASLELHHLYDHYEQRTFADAMDEEFPVGEYRLEPPTPTGPAGNAYLSPFPPNGTRPVHHSKQAPLTAMELKLAGVGSPSSPAAGDCASVSSRHTRTSKASKRTDRSLQEIDLLQNSVLALSSDSEDDYELSSKGSLAVPALSDGQMSPTSPRSPMSQTSTGPYEGSRGKSGKRASFGNSPHLFPGSQAPATKKAPKISPRTSSLNSKSSSKSAHALVHETSRLSIGTTSTDRTVSHAPTNKAPKKMRNDSQFDFPAPPVHRGARSSSASRASEHSHPVSPTSVDLDLQSQRSPAGLDNGSIRSGTSLGSAANRRNSAASSVRDDSSGRFMAVTRQEEMLLAALRMKRARMREDIIAEFEEEMDREEHQLSREVTNESVITTGSMSRQSSRSTMRQEPPVPSALSARPRQQGQAPAPERKAKGEPLKVVIDQSRYDTLRTPASEFSDFIHLEVNIPSPGLGVLERKDSRASSINSQNSASTRQRSSLSAIPPPAQRRSLRREGSASRRAPEQVSPKGQHGHGQNDLPHQILEDPAEDEDVGIPRPDSPISPADFPTPVSIKNKKQVRLSAVGFYKPVGEAGW